MCGSRTAGNLPAREHADIASTLHQSSPIVMVEDLPIRGVLVDGLWAYGSPDIAVATPYHG